MKKLLIPVLLCSACERPAPAPDGLKPVATAGTSQTPPVETGFSPSPCTTSKAILCPVDEAPQDASFADYRRKLRDAVAHRGDTVEARVSEIVTDPWTVHEHP